MFIGLAIVLIIAWALGFIVFHVASFFIHILLILGIISIVLHLFKKKPVA